MKIEEARQLQKGAYLVVNEDMELYRKGQFLLFVSFDDDIILVKDATRITYIKPEYVHVYEGATKPDTEMEAKRKSYVCSTSVGLANAGGSTIFFHYFIDGEESDEVASIVINGEIFYVDNKALLEEIIDALTSINAKVK